MVIGVEASNIRTGGGLIHLKEVLENLNPVEYGIEKIVLFSSEKTNSFIKDFVWLEKPKIDFLNTSSFKRILWQYVLKEKFYHKYRCDVIFVPGAIVCRYKNYVSMCQNQLPFDQIAYKSYSSRKTKIQLLTLRFIQSKSFQNSSGTIFLSEYSKKGVFDYFPSLSNINNGIIPHGLNSLFLTGDNRTYHAKEEPVKLLMVSTLNSYKYAINLVHAVIILKKLGFKVLLTLIGGNAHNYFSKIDEVVQNNSELKDTIYYHEFIPYEKLPSIYSDHDIFVYTSICETFGMTVLEAMGTGIPIACSNRGAMKETLKDAGIYFDTFEIKEIALAIEKYLLSENLREEKGRLGYEYAKKYRWKEVSENTFEFIKSSVNQ